MPTYTLTVPHGQWDASQKSRAAAAIARIHNEVTGAATFFAQVIIHELPDENYFVGGVPLQAAQVHLQGQIRAGRSAADRNRLLIALRDGLVAETGCAKSDVWIYLVDLPARDMIEYGHILPEPGDEATWLTSLPDEDRVRMMKTGAG
jgi:phenylpyruvate tautomerase PptA (4-oxalocrotonate tautomerase family)